MATTIVGISRSKILTNLDTYNHTTGSAQQYGIAVSIMERPPSGLIITIQNNGVTQATTTVAPATGQQVVELFALINCAQGDVLSVILSSSAVIDTRLNHFKATLRIAAGQRA